MPEDDLFTDSPVDGIEHEPGQVRREGLAQIREAWCTPMCGMCSNNTYEHCYGKSASKDSIKIRRDLLIDFYAKADEMTKDGYCWPIW